MGHAISTFIARDAAINRLSAALGNAPVIRAGDNDICFLPVTEEVFDLATSLKGDSDPVGEDYYRFSKSLAAIAAQCSGAGPIAHVFTEYFGGDGSQGATVWSAGALAMKPETGRMGPINRALRAIGIKAMPPQDEFDTIGLGKYRSNDDFGDASEAPSPPPAKPRSWLRRLLGFNS